jgi:hypothetical protein
MSIIRKSRPETNFYILDKKISEDRSLSWGARGLLIFLLGKPDNWRVSTQNLINETCESSRPSGRDSVKGFIQELIEVGYMVRSEKPSHQEDGTFGAYDYIVSETPHTSTDKPSTDKPSTVQPSTANPLLLSIEKTSRIEKKTKSDESATRPIDVSSEIWKDFLTMRKAQKAPVTETAMKGFIRESVRANLTLEEVLELCCLKGWRGFNADWLTRAQDNAPKRGGGNDNDNRPKLVL